MKELLKFVILAMLAVGGYPAAAGLWDWSTTAGNNATADPSINWSEGQSPSSVNDSARAMMAKLAAWRNDISATNTSTGTSTAYALATSEGVDTTPVNGQMIAFVAHATNGASPTLAVDGGTAFPLWLNGSAAGAGTLISGTPYRVAFNAANSAWLLEGGIGNPYSIPLGGLLASTVAAPPNSNFILPAGQCISTTTYAAYWVAVGSPASGACPGGQFAVMDMRGRVPVPLDNLNGSSASRVTSTGCGVALTSIGAVCTGLQTFALSTGNLPPYTPAGSVTGYIEMDIFTVSSAGGVNAWVVGGGTSSGTEALINGLLVGTAQGGISTPISRIGPAIGVSYFLRVF